MLLYLQKCFALLLGLFPKADGVCLRHREVLLGVAWCCLGTLKKIQASTVLAAIVFGAVVVKGRMVFVPGRLWMLSCRSVVVLAGTVSPALLGVMLCGGLVVWPALRALTPMSARVLRERVRLCLHGFVVELEQWWVEIVVKPA